MVTRAIALFVVFVFAAAAFGACNQAPSTSSTRPAKFFSKKDPAPPAHVLVKDLVRAGLVPGTTLPKDMKVELSKRSPKGFEGMDSYKAGNAILFLNAADQKLHTAIISGAPSANAEGLSMAELKMEDGRSVLGLSPDDIVKAYGEPSYKTPMSEGDKPAMGYYYSYKQGANVITVIFHFPKDGEILKPMSAVVLDMHTKPEDIKALTDLGKPFDWPEK